MTPFNNSNGSGYPETFRYVETRKLNLRRFEDLDDNNFVAKTSTFRRLRRFVKRSLLAQTKRVISWPISVIVEAQSQLGHATKDKLESDGDKVVS